MHELVAILKADFFRVHGKADWTSFVQELIKGETFKFLFWFRVKVYLSKKSILVFPLRAFSSCMLSHYRYKFGICISSNVKVGLGLRLPHIGGIICNDSVIIGDNCTILHGVTLGNKMGVEGRNTPIIGNKVYIGPGSIIIGGIHIGDECVIGANTVVTKDLPSGSVVFGNPAVIRNDNYSKMYCRNIVEVNNGVKSDV